MMHEGTYTEQKEEELKHISNGDRAASLDLDAMRG